MRVFLRQTLIFILLMGGNFIVQLGTNPRFSGMPNDSGVFAYCGQRILAGDLLYRDCWDNKPPAVYYIDAAAIALGFRNPNSLGVFQATWFGLTAIAFYLVLSKIWNWRLAVSMAFVFLLTALYPVYYEQGNLTETYVLMALILTFGALYGYLRTGRRPYLVGIGLLIACAFLLKQTYIGVGIATCLVLLFLDWRQRGLRQAGVSLGILAASVGIPLLLVASYWLFQSEFGTLWFAIFSHNVQYTQESLSLVSLFKTGRMLLTLQPMATVVALASMSAVLFFHENGRGLKHSVAEETLPFECESACRWWLVAVLLSIPLDLAFLAMTGKNFGHYYLVPLPALVMCSSYLFKRVVETLRRRPFPDWSLALIVATVFLSMGWLIEIVGKEVPSVESLGDFWQAPNLFVYQPTQGEHYIMEHTSPSDSVLIWSSDPSLNFITGRRSPTRFIFLRHLLTPVLGDSSGFDRFLQELQEDPPALIVAEPGASAELPYFAVSEDELCPLCTPMIREEMRELKEYIDSHYTLKTQMGDWFFFGLVQ